LRAATSGSAIRGTSFWTVNLVPFGASESVGRVGSLRFGHDVRPQTPVRQIVEVEELRGAAVIEPDFIAATVPNGFVLSEVHSAQWSCGDDAAPGGSAQIINQLRSELLEATVHRGWKRI